MLFRSFIVVLCGYLLACDDISVSKAGSSPGQQEESGGGASPDLMGDLKKANKNQRIAIIKQQLAKNPKIEDLEKTDPDTGNSIWHYLLGASPSITDVKNLAAKSKKDLNTPDNFNKTPFNLAVENGSVAPEVLKELIEQGVQYDKEDLRQAALDDKPEYFKVIFADVYKKNKSLSMLMDKDGYGQSPLDSLFNNHRSSFCDSLYQFLIDEISDEDKTVLLKELFAPFTDIISSIDDNKDVPVENTFVDIKRALLEKDSKDFHFICKDPQAQADLLNKHILQQKRKAEDLKKEEAYQAKLAAYPKTIEDYKSDIDRGNFANSFYLNQGIEKFIVDKMNSNWKWIRNDEKYKLINEKIEALKNIYDSYYENFIKIDGYAYGKTNEEAYQEEFDKIKVAQQFALDNKSAIEKYTLLETDFYAARDNYEEAMNKAATSNQVKTTEGSYLGKMGGSDSYYMRKGNSGESFSLKKLPNNLTQEAKDYITTNVIPINEQLEEATKKYDDFINAHLATKPGFAEWQKYKGRTVDFTQTKLQEIAKIKSKYDQAWAELKEALKTLISK